MAIPVTCPGCKKTFNVDDKFAGKTGPCPQCKTKITIPEKKPEVKVHAPDEFSGGGRGVTGKLALKPIAREQARLKPATIAIIGGCALGAIAYALAIRFVAPQPGMLRMILTGVGLALVGLPLAIAAYTFLRDDELEPYRGMELVTRAGVCGLVYAILWGVFAYIKVTVFGAEQISLPLWLAVAPPFLIVGGMAGKFSLDLETLNGFFHYAFYAVLTVLLGMIAGVSQAIWS